MGIPVMPIFIFDSNIITELPPKDARITFIHSQLARLHTELKQFNSSLAIFHGDPLSVWKDLIQTGPITSVFYNRDYEPYGLERDGNITRLFSENGVSSQTFKDQVIFEKDEVVKKDGLPYTVFTPYKNRWLDRFEKLPLEPELNTENLFHFTTKMPTLQAFGFETSEIKVIPYDISVAHNYAQTRDFPSVSGTSNLGPHLRFGTVSVRSIVRNIPNKSSVFLSELIWREFFMQIMWHFPQVQSHNFKRKYDGVAWRNNEEEFKTWCEGNTGFPMVDAGIRELLATGHMHNRVRMIVAGFLCKHLLIDWKWGEAFFAQHLLDYELSSNNGNWQWAAGTGCDSAPYFRIFNPSEQLKKFDKQLEYIHKWIPEYNMGLYLPPMVDHKIARLRALETYKSGILQ
jgi:deoxyribodipyrimidine photo-lyase